LKIIDRINRIVWIFCKLAFRKKASQTNPPSGGKKKRLYPILLNKFLHTLMVNSFLDHNQALLPKEDGIDRFLQENGH